MRMIAVSIPKLKERKLHGLGVVVDRLKEDV